MPIRNPFIRKQSATSIVDHGLGEAYETVKEVRDNLEPVIVVANMADNIQTVTDSIEGSAGSAQAFAETTIIKADQALISQESATASADLAVASSATSVGAAATASAASLASIAAQAAAENLMGDAATALAASTASLAALTGIRFNEIATTNIPSVIKRFHTTGHSAIGIGAAEYVPYVGSAAAAKRASLRADAIANGTAAAAVDAALNATEAFFTATDGLGRKWTIARDQQAEDTMFGAIHDATFDNGAVWSVRWTGTDNTAAIQAMVDWAIYFGGRRDIHLSDGNCLVTNTIHLGYGDRFNTSLVLSGYASLADPTYELAGCCIVHNFVNAPVMNIQGARGVVLDNFSFEGPSFKYINDSGLANPDMVPTVDDSIAANWEDPAIVAGVGHGLDERYRPQAAITIDAYAGVRPANSYPDAIYPTWLPGQATQWGKNRSSDVSIAPTTMFFRGEINCAVSHPSGSDGNGDFITFGRVGYVRCKRFYSVGQTQARSAKFGYLLGAQCYEVLSNRTHGLQKGNLTAGFDFLHVSGIMQVASLNGSAVSGSLTFNDCYFEAAYRLFELDGANANEGQYTINNINIYFGMQNASGRPIPAKIIYTSINTVSSILVVFNGGMLIDHKALTSDAPLSLQGGVQLDNSFAGTDEVGTTSAQALWNNATLGGVVALRGVFGPVSVKMPRRDIDNPAVMANAAISDGYREATRRYGFPVWLNYAQTMVTEPDANVATPDVLVPNPYAGLAEGSPDAMWRPFPKGAMTANTVTSNATGFFWNFTYPYGRANVLWQGLGAGDMIYDPDTGMVFYVQSTAGTAISAQAITGIKLVAGAWVPHLPFSHNIGTAESVKLRRFLPNAAIFADFTVSSASLTNVAWRNGDALAAGIVAVNDQWECNRHVDGVLGSSLGGNILNAVDFTAKTMTLSGTAARTVAAQRMLVWQRSA